MQHTQKIAPISSVFAVAMFAALAPAGAQLSEDFELDYTDGSIVGQVGGADGWQPASSWTKSSGTVLDYNIVSHGSDQVLQASKPTPSTGGSNTVGRQYADPGAGTYQIEFSLTLNNLAGFSDKNGGDYLNIFDMPAAPDFSPAGTWLVRGGNAGVAGNDLTWRFYDGNEDSGSFNQAQFVDSGISLLAGSTYTFTLNILGSGDWTASVSNGVNSFTSGILGFRNTAPLPSRRINFGIADGGTAAQVSFDVNSIEVGPFSPIPEPSSAITAMLLLGTAGVARPRGRR